MVRLSIVTVLAVSTVLAGTLGARSQAPAARPVPATDQYLFPSGAGVLFFHVRPDRTQDFEAVLGRLGEVLDQSFDPIRKQQAASWRMFKSVETPRDAVIYVFFFDPAVFGADYDPVKILGEAVPTDVQGLYERLRADVVRVERMGLTKLR